MQRTLIALSILAALVTVGCTNDTSQEDPNNANRGEADYFDECVDGCVADRGMTEAECELACEDSADGDCAADADAAYTDCLDAGGTDEDCREDAGEAYDACAGDRSTGTATDPCSEAADRAYDECIDAGGTEEDCREEAGVAYDDCVGGSGTTTETRTGSTTGTTTRTY